MTILQHKSGFIVLASIVTAAVVIGTLGDLQTITAYPIDGGVWLFSGTSDGVVLLITACMAFAPMILLAGSSFVGDSYSVVKGTHFFLAMNAVLCLFYIGSSIVAFTKLDIYLFEKQKNLKITGAVFGLVSGLLHAMVLVAEKYMN